MTHQWFDMWPLDTYAPEHKQEVQLNGLKESVKYLHGLVKEAAEEVGAENVVVVGLSQGCALGLVALLLWDGARLGAFVGMCGWLPLRKSMSEALEDDNDGDGCDDGLFERAGSDSHGPEKKTKVEQAVDWLRDELNLPVEGPLNPNPKDGSPVTTPIFLGHGMEDEKVPFELGKLASQFLKELGLDVTWEEYPELAHWYSADMLTDVLGFIQSHTPSA
jgi:predicted esterase